MWSLPFSTNIREDSIKTRINKFFCVGFFFPYLFFVGFLQLKFKLNSLFVLHYLGFTCDVEVKQSAIQLAFQSFLAQAWVICWLGAHKRPNKILNYANKILAAWYDGIWFLHRESFVREDIFGNLGVTGSGFYLVCVYRSIQIFPICIEIQTTYSQLMV